MGAQLLGCTNLDASRYQFGDRLRVAFSKQRQYLHNNAPKVNTQSENQAQSAYVLRGRRLRPGVLAEPAAQHRARQQVGSLDQQGAEQLLSTTTVD
jgi:hypothetical protein